MRNNRKITMNEAEETIKALKGKELKVIIVSENELKVIDLPEYGSTILHSQGGKVTRLETTTSEKL